MEHNMAGEELNGTMTMLANSTETPKYECTDLKNFKWLSTFLSPYLWFIFTLGFIENLFVISVFVLHKSRCTVTEIYLGNMAAADLIFVIGHPFWATYISNNYNWTFGGFMCSAISSLFLLNLYSSIYFLMMVSIERYLALVKPMTIGRLRKPWWAKVTCGIIWVFAALLCVPDGMFHEVEITGIDNTTMCVYNYPVTWDIASNIITNVLGFLVPLVVTSFCTCQMICVLRRNTMQKFKKVNKERKASCLVLSIFLVFTVCWIPFNVFTLIDTLYEFNIFGSCMVTSVNNIVYSISFYLVYSNSCINPVLYCMVGNNFRQKAREVYCRILCKEPDRWRSSLPTDESSQH
ncbi:B2 bradykinin receptor-like [Dendropsophus ebraccatus]|uniref:B2 bradykinin receptor-like n=1 Tax=Dendropsophus ebraccatus TaxID=150705 RepID=UPI003831E05C